MAQEFFINSQELEDKIRQLLPSQGGAGAGFDLSASTQIIPIIDLTESASGSNLRQDLQSSLSLNDVTAFNVTGTDTLITTTGYYRVFGNLTVENRDTAENAASFTLTDGVSSKIIYECRIAPDTQTFVVSQNFDFVVFIGAGDSLTSTVVTDSAFIIGCTKQLASIDGTLTTPT